MSLKNTKKDKKQSGVLLASVQDNENGPKEKTESQVNIKKRIGLKITLFHIMFNE